MGKCSTTWKIFHEFWLFVFLRSKLWESPISRQTWVHPWHYNIPAEIFESYDYSTRPHFFIDSTCPHPSSIIRHVRILNISVIIRHFRTLEEFWNQNWKTWHIILFIALMIFKRDFNFCNQTVILSSLMMNSFDQL